ncbi:unnamed protein product, partial [Amoebophrya sp. A25]
TTEARRRSVNRQKFAGSSIWLCNCFGSAKLSEREGKVGLHFCPTDEQRADIFTKALKSRSRRL